MNSFWIEQQARQRTDEFAADARGDQLVRATETSETRRRIFGRRPSLRPLAWIDVFMARSRRPVGRTR